MAKTIGQVLKSLGIGVKGPIQQFYENDPYGRFIAPGGGAVRGEPMTPEILEARRRYQALRGQSQPMSSDYSRSDNVTFQGYIPEESNQLGIDIPIEYVPRNVAPRGQGGYGQGLFTPPPESNVPFPDYSSTTFKDRVSDAVDAIGEAQANDMLNSAIHEGEGFRPLSLTTIFDNWRKRVGPMAEAIGEAQANDMLNSAIHEGTGFRPVGLSTIFSNWADRAKGLFSSDGRKDVPEGVTIMPDGSVLLDEQARQMDSLPQEQVVEVREIKQELPPTLTRLPDGNVILTDQARIVDPATSRLYTTTGFDDATWSAYRQGIADIESSGGDYKAVSPSGTMLGKYQMSKDARADAAKDLGISNPSKEEFLNNPDLQEKMFAAYTRKNYMHLIKNSPEFAAMSESERLETLARAQLGAERLRRVLSTGQEETDALGTKTQEFADSVKARLDALNKKVEEITNIRPSLPVIP